MQTHKLQQGFSKDFFIFIINFGYAGKKIYTIKFSTENIFHNSGASSNCRVCMSQDVMIAYEDGQYNKQDRTLCLSAAQSHSTAMEELSPQMSSHIKPLQLMGSA